MRRYFDHADIVDLNQRFLDHVLSHDWDILCLCTISHYAYFLLPGTLCQLSGAGKLVVGFFGDDETMFHQHKYWLGLFDAVVAYSEREVERYQQWNRHTYLLPISIGEFPDIPPAPDRDIDVIFVGRPYGVRADMIRAVKEAGISIQVFGSKRWGDYPELGDIYQGFLNREVFWQQLSRAKIVLNLMEDVTGKGSHLNAKVFETAMAGALSVTTYYPPFETTYGLEDGEHVVFYRSIDDVIAKLKYYLTHDERRERIAERLQKHLLEHFSYRDLYRKLFTDLEDQWRSNASDGILRQPVETSHFTVIQMIRNDDDADRARQAWSTYPDLQVIYVSQTRNHPYGAHTTSGLRRLLRADSVELRDYVILATPQTTYDPSIFGLITRYAPAGFFQDGVFCDSVVRGRRLRKSIHLFDLGSSIWRREAFLAHATWILLWYQFMGTAIPRLMTRFKLASMPVFLNAVSDGRAASQLERYRALTDAARKLKQALTRR